MSQLKPQPLAKQTQQILGELAKEITASLTLKQQIGQLFMLHLPLKPSNTTYKKIQPGGVFIDFRNGFGKAKNGFFRQDYHKLVKHLKKLNSYYLDNNIPSPLYTIDQEGGYHKLRGPATYFPTLMAVGEAVKTSGNRSWANKVGFYTCHHLQQAGIQWNLAPVTDVQINPQNPVIRTRAFHSDPEFVTELVAAYLSGHRAAGCLDSIKHFPGHGDTSKDSHHQLPIVKKKYSRLLKEDLKPFKTIIARNLATGVMPAHIIYPNFENKPATFSKYWLTKTLRQKWKFKGLIITDNLSMRAVPKFRREKTYHKVGYDALKAGADVLLLTSGVVTLGRQMVEGISTRAKSSKKLRARIAVSVERIIYHKLFTGTLDRYLERALKSKKPWANKNQWHINRWLSISQKRQADRLQMKEGLISPTELNRKIARAAIKTLHGHKNLKKYISSGYNYPLFTDVNPKSKIYGQLKKEFGKIMPLSSLKTKARKYKKAMVLNTRVNKFRKGLPSWQRQRPKGHYIFFALPNPYPYGSLKRLLRKKDVLVVPFSKSPESKRALVEAVLHRKVPPSATVKVK